MSEFAESRGVRVHETMSEFVESKGVRAHETESEFAESRGMSAHETESEFVKSRGMSAHEIKSEFVGLREASSLSLPARLPSNSRGEGGETFPAAAKKSGVAQRRKKYPAQASDTFE